ncbi:hypothetical protein XENTR_v10015338 [Xenopus tropicalis]|uniref:Coiled-coil domain containing 166 n=1 Tax=Xenopus tropicalis TaxID=8364 RepID=A0A1B8XVX5_XENTR|nr:coiled-coil domain-containing protein 166 [Xenopus tropicalis]KAE8605842.1 hypothetical protein XENTR_v10015338 [Xenopus tropicalis]|eukprot:XP_004920349.1 PREDICTED: coiled-coil domain-containing protein 166 [Xenopus tropicalis]
MPPKKGVKKGAKAAGKEAPAEAGEAGREAPGERPVSEREARMEAEHALLTAEQEGLRKRMEQLRKENEFLQEEAERLRIESHEYLSYMGKRSQRQHHAIVTLSDQHHRDLQDIAGHKRALEAQLEAEEEKLREKLLQREAQLAKVMEELEGLEPMKELRRQQLVLIRELEEEVMGTRGRHAQAMLRVKSAFLRDKAQCQKDSERQLDQLSQEAHKEAKKAIVEMSSRVRGENQQLRQELLLLIRSARLLQAHKHKLEEQNRQLVREQQCRRELVNAHRRLGNISLPCDPVG